ncbi:MAG: hypothetical protein FJX25_09870 [Alphaproteobacteria bacterium]|nr:hypothetical protein [Alphaproteobacteria bacterium]
MIHLQAPSVGFSADALQIPELDFVNASHYGIFVEESQTAEIDLAPGVYFIACDVDFVFAHTPAGVYPVTMAPWPKKAYLTLYVSTPQKLVIETRQSGDVVVIPTKVY